ncbi:MAG: RdgB/HAM1 family non-canonical purine NTP pyrophosphatase [Candidatus Omnitrophota bacterium]|nr:RdgB/HAM1 family non-canonical purine NTP pyrophosphatase [Candidatus Omnitrophota bacterium]
MQLIVATKNKKKLIEIKDLLQGLNLEIFSLADFPDAPKIEEDGKTFEQNAIKKAATIAMYTKKLTLGEDSGLEVKALKNKPGIYSSRFSGENATDKKNNLKLLRLLRNIPLDKRVAVYKCSVALVDRKKIIYLTTGKCEGKIGLRSRGKFGFGYDPLFIPKGFKETFGKLNPEIKRRISHRAKALKKLRPIFSEYSQK